MGSFMRKVWSAMSTWSAALASALALTLLANTQVAAELHGRIWPVVTPLTVTSITPTYRHVADGVPPMLSTRIAGDAVILRECDNPRVKWELQGVTKTYDLKVENGDPPQDRKLGPSHWESIIVGIAPDHLYQTRGYAEHSCDGLPVKSPFYIPSIPDSLPDAVIEELGATAECQSGAYSKSTGSGTCSHHGGVLRWLPSEENA